MSADVWESHDRVTGPYCRTCGSDSVGCSDCHEAELATLRTTLAQVTAERDAQVDTTRAVQLQLATLRADLAAQVEGMDTLTIGSYGIMAENVRIVGKTQFVSRDEVLTLLRGPHAD